MNSNVVCWGPRWWVLSSHLTCNNNETQLCHCSIVVGFTCARYDFFFIYVYDIFVINIKLAGHEVSSLNWYSGYIYIMLYYVSHAALIHFCCQFFFCRVISRVKVTLFFIDIILFILITYRSCIISASSLQIFTNIIS